MKKNRYKLLLVCLFLCVSAALISTYYNKPKDEAYQTTVVSNIYNPDAQDIDWVIENSDFIIEGLVVDISKPIKGIDNTPSKNSIVYSDATVEISKILKNNTNKTFKNGDKITVRYLGGSVGKFSFKTDSENIMTKNKDMYICLIDGEKDITLPKTDDKYFSIVSDIHGAFEVNNSNLTRIKVKDSIQKETLENKIKQKSK